MSSKLDYLKKYMSGASDEPSSSSSNDKKKKKKKKETPLATRPRGMVIVDDEVRVESRAFDSDDDDTPVVLDSSGRELEKGQLKSLKNAHSSSWVDVDDGRSNSRNQDISPPRRQRHDSPDASPPRRNRHDSPDMSPPRRQRHDSPDRDSSPPRRQNNDSPSNKRSRDSDSSPPRRQRHDSPDLSPPRRPSSSSSSSKRHESPDLSPPRRGDSSSSKRRSSPDLSPPRRRSDDRAKDDDVSPPRKRAAHSSSEDSHRPMVASVLSSSSSSASKLKMLDGTAAGLRTLDQVRDEASHIRASDRHRMANLDPKLSGQNADTIYRDKHGRKLEGLTEMMRLQKGSAAFADDEESKHKWGKGVVQQQQEMDLAKRLMAEKSAPLAVYEDDADRDAMFRAKDRGRWGDPMADLLKSKGEEGSSSSARPKYKGSWPPNRFNIAPGYRWDGVDRSNGFEKEWFKHQNAAKSRSDAEYRWSTSEM